MTLDVPATTNGSRAQSDDSSKLSLAMGLFALVLLAGCGTGANNFATPSGGVALSGTVHGGQQPVTEATLQLYAMGTTGTGSAATPLLTHTVQTDSNGSFNFTGLYTCPSGDTQVYLVARGGNPGLAAGINNSAIGLMAALGPCGLLTSSTYITVNEVTTVGSIWPLAPFSKSILQIGSGNADAPALKTAVNGVFELVSVASGASPGPGLADSEVAPVAKLNMLADVLAACVNTSGGVAGDGSFCGRLFSAATVSGGTPPNDTLAAALAIANNPGNAVSQLFTLPPPSSPFQPRISSLPTDWTLPILSAPDTPIISPNAQTLVAGQAISISESTLGAKIHYTTDGTIPTSNSASYSNSITANESMTVKAIGMLNGLSSAVISATYNVAPAAPVITPGSGMVSYGQNVTISDSAAAVKIYYTMDGSRPTASSTVYSAPISVKNSVTLQAVAILNNMTSDVASATLSIPVIVGLAPSSATVSPSQTVTLASAVSGSANQAVTWSVSPAIGTISARGVYTAPATVPYPGGVTITATSMADPTSSASVQVTIAPVVGTTYYLSTAAAGGKDSNDGLSPAKPWLTPNHSVHCGDVINAAPGTSYVASSFATGHWGKVTCESGNNVAWLKCATFDGCKITSDQGSAGMWVDQSYWGVQGWEVTMTSGATYGGCFIAAPNYLAPLKIHHIIFANDIANGCQAGGFGSTNHGPTTGVDYVAVVGSIAYNAAQGNTECYSGISIYQPTQSDSLAGTHFYLGGNFSYGNVNPNPCGGGAPTDGEGIILDVLDTFVGLASPYSMQVVVDNNLMVANGGRGLQADYNKTGLPPFASIYFRNNTMWGNNRDLNQHGTACGEVTLNAVFNIDVSRNIAVANAARGCGNNPTSAFFIGNSSTPTDLVYQNWGYAASGNNSTTLSSPGFTLGMNTFGIDPHFANPVVPADPSCSSSSSVPNCMAAVTADFTPMNTTALAYGYQSPANTPVYDPLFPQWLCNVNLPAGLVSMGCRVAP